MSSSSTASTPASGTTAPTPKPDTSEATDTLKDSPAPDAVKQEIAQYLDDYEAHLRDELDHYFSGSTEPDKDEDKE
jgi:hypothetical protein